MPTPTVSSDADDFDRTDESRGGPAHAQADLLDLGGEVTDRGRSGCGEFSKRAKRTVLLDALVGAHKEAAKTVAALQRVLPAGRIS
jgi:hypothetical protein